MKSTWDSNETICWHFSISKSMTMDLTIKRVHKEAQAKKMATTLRMKPTFQGWSTSIWINHSFKFIWRSSISWSTCSQGSSNFKTHSSRTGINQDNNRFRHHPSKTNCSWRNGVCRFHHISPWRSGTRWRWKNNTSLSSKIPSSKVVKDSKIHQEGSHMSFRTLWDLCPGRDYRQRRIRSKVVKSNRMMSEVQR